MRKKLNVNITPYYEIINISGKELGIIIRSLKHNPLQEAQELAEELDNYRKSETERISTAVNKGGV